MKCDTIKGESHIQMSEVQQLKHGLLMILASKKKKKMFLTLFCLNWYLIQSPPKVEAVRTPTESRKEKLLELVKTTKFTAVSLNLRVSPERSVTKSKDIKTRHKSGLSLL